MQRPRLKLGLLAALTGLSAWGVGAQTYPSDLARLPGVEVRTYEVQGRDPVTIRRSINARRPRDPHDQSPSDALSTWRISWRWSGDGRGGCDLAHATVSFQAVVLLPSLANEVSLHPVIQARWRAYLTALDHHEADHLRYAYAHRIDVQRALAASRCEDADAAAEAAVAAIDRWQVAYDRATLHGVTQGAVFP